MTTLYCANPKCDWSGYFPATVTTVKVKDHIKVYTPIEFCPECNWDKLTTK